MDVESESSAAIEANDAAASFGDTPVETRVDEQQVETVAPMHLSRRARRQQRVSKWDRPPQPHDWRFFVGHLGRILITTGLMMFLFVAYQLWGTGIETARAQNKLDDQFQQVVAQVVAEESGPDVERAPNIVTDDGLVVDPTSVGAAFQALPFPNQIVDESGTEGPATPYETIVPAEDQNLPEVKPNGLLGKIQIPTIGVDFYFVSGVTHEALKSGVGYFDDTPLPGQLGNSALAGHRTTYKAPFGDLDEVNVGDDIVITLTNDEVYTYVATGITIVNPTDYWVISDSDPNLATLTLITCTPKATSKQRLVVFAELDPTRSGLVGQATIPQFDELQSNVLPDEPPATSAAAPTTAAVTASSAATTTISPVNTTDSAGTAASTAETVVEGALPAATVPTSAAPATTIAPALADTDDTSAPGEGDAFSGSWFDDTAAWPHIAGWGALLSIIAIGAYLISRKTRHDSIGLLVGIVPFTVVLYFFFENVNRLLPPGL